MSSVPSVKINFKKWDYERKLKLGFHNLRQHPQWDLREAFFSATGAKCSSDLDCTSCGGIGLFPACESCEEGYQICYECEGNTTIDCEDCDTSGEVVEECGDCKGLGMEECSVCDGETQIPCEDCDGGDASCGDCEGNGVIEVSCTECHNYEEHETCEYCNGTELVEENCSNCEGHGEYPCESCEGAGEFVCSSCDGSGSTKPCPHCEGAGEISETCGECGGDGEIHCGWCEEGYNECGECGGDPEESECDNCNAQGNFTREHEKAGEYYLNPIRANRKKRVEMFDTAMKELWPQIVEGGYKVDFMPTRKVNYNYFKQRIFDKVTLLLVPCGDVTHIFIINHLKPNIENRNEIGLYYSIRLESLTSSWGYHLFKSCFTLSPQHPEILSAPLYNEAMIITTNITIWEPFTMNYLTEPTQKT